jgi:DNA-binding NtrC family response regulator
MPKKPVILLVDDDEGQRSLLAAFLKGQRYAILEAGSGQAGLDILRAKPVDLLISDVRMPGMNGLELLVHARGLYPELPVLLVTAFADIRDAVKAVHQGAVNYLEKPIDFAELNGLLETLLGNPQSHAEIALPHHDNVIAESPAMRHLLEEIAIVAPTSSRVLITGESGVGKEVVARLIHQNSPRLDGPLVTVNCAAVPETLIESELFGHEKGSFTGAINQRIGRFEQAIGGTLLLDEIGELPPQVQVKLLRVLQEGVFNRIGSNGEIRTDARILAASNRNLETEVRAGRFREDLFYRLNVFELYIPPLRERPEDILPLARFFMKQHGNNSARLTPAVTAMLTAWPWPGNVRELQNALERAALLAQGGVILPEHLPRKLQEAAGTKGAKTGGGEDGKRMQDVERCTILQTLHEHGNNRTETALALGISRRALLYKLQHYREQGYTVEG